MKTSPSLSSDSSIPTMMEFSPPSKSKTLNPVQNLMPKKSTGSSENMEEKLISTNSLNLSYQSKVNLYCIQFLILSKAASILLKLKPFLKTRKSRIWTKNKSLNNSWLLLISIMTVTSNLVNITLQTNSWTRLQRTWDLFSNSSTRITTGSFQQRN